VRESTLQKSPKLESFSTLVCGNIAEDCVRGAVRFFYP
jgi:hypothetical protein